MKRVIALLREAEQSSRDTDDEGCDIDAAYFASAVNKLERGITVLTDNERDVVVDEVETELSRMQDAKENFGPLSKEDLAYVRELKAYLKTIMA